MHCNVIGRVKGGDTEEELLSAELELWVRSLEAVMDLIPSLVLFSPHLCTKAA